MTQLKNDKKGNITPEMNYVASFESIPVETLMNDIACGHTVLLKNKIHKSIQPVAVVAPASPR